MQHLIPSNYLYTTPSLHKIHPHLTVPQELRDAQQHRRLVAGAGQLPQCSSLDVVNVADEDTLPVPEIIHYITTQPSV